MKNIWIFGDSYAVNQDELNQRIWMNIVSKKLNYKVTNFASGGSSLDFTYFKFDQHYRSISKNDVIIISLTNIDRRYFISSNPNVSSINHSLDKNYRHISDEVKTAIFLYYKYLDNVESFKIGLINFLYRLQLLAEKLFLKIILIKNFVDLDFIDSYSGFNNLNISKGCLFAISSSECQNEDLHRRIMRSYQSISDPRANHLCYSNHSILANKIINNITNNTPLDLSTGFSNNLLTFNNCKDTSLHKEEFIYYADINIG